MQAVQKEKTKNENKVFPLPLSKMKLREKNIEKPAFASLMWLFEVLSFYTKRTQAQEKKTI